MKKLLLAVLISFSLGTFCSGQDFSFDELVKLRTDKYLSFEAYVHDKGYTMSDVGHDEMVTVFRNGKNVIVHSHHNYGDGLTYHKHASVTYETPVKADYEILKKQIEAELKLYSTQLHKHRRMNYIEHIYANDAIVVRLYSIAYRDDDKPYYKIEVSSIYAGMEQE